MNNKLFSVTGSKFANLCDFVAEISIAENIYHGTSTDLANLNLGNLNLGDVHIFSTILAHFENLLYIGPPLDVVELKK